MRAPMGYGKPGGVSAQLRWKPPPREDEERGHVTNDSLVTYLAGPLSQRLERTWSAPGKGRRRPDPRIGWPRVYLWGIPTKIEWLGYIWAT